MDTSNHINPNDIFDDLLSGINESYERGEINKNIPGVLGGFAFSINDEEVSVSLVLTDDHYCLWSVLGGWYVETILCDKSVVTVGQEDWMDVMKTDKHYAIFRQVLKNSISAAANVAEDQKVDEDEIEFNTRVAITESLDQPRKLPTICTFAFYGTIIPGLKGLEDYCKLQDDTSSPYILKKTLHFQQVGVDFDKYRVVNYLICRDKDDAVRCMVRFCYLVNDIDKLNDALNYNRPPLISYTEGQNYLTLV